MKNSDTLDPATIPRRRFLKAGCAVSLGLAARMHAQLHGPMRLLAYVSSYTTIPYGGSIEGGIHVFEVNRNDGTLKYLSTTTPSLSGGFICIAPDGQHLYSTDERTDYGHVTGAGGGVFAFSIDRATGSLTEVSDVPSVGTYPAYISISPNGNLLLVANHGDYAPSSKIVRDPSGAHVESVYDDSCVALFRIAPSGAVQPASTVDILDKTHKPFKVAVDNPRSEKFQKSPHAHAVDFVPNTPFALACDKGMDRVYVYRVGESTLERIFVYDAPPQTAPRHSAFHPKKAFVFIVNEIVPSMSSLRIDRMTGALTHISTVSTISKELAVEAQMLPSEIVIHPGGRFVYATTRSCNTIAAIRIDQESGTLTQIQVVASGGRNPRSFRIDPTGAFLFSCNQDTGDIFTFRIDQDNGRLTPTGAKTSIPRPVSMRFLEVPA